MFRIRFIRVVGISYWRTIGGNRSIIQFNKWYVWGSSLWSVNWYNWLIIVIRFSSTISSVWKKDWRLTVWSFTVTVRLLNQIRKWVIWIIKSLINPLDLGIIFSNVAAFFKVRMMSMALRLTQPNFIKRRQMIDKRVISGERFVIEILVTIGVKGQRDGCKYH